MPGGDDDLEGSPVDRLVFLPTNAVSLKALWIISGLLRLSRDDREDVV